jgi:archaellum component FlaG (FlaF/FlaG flagellin family)
MKAFKHLYSKINKVAATSALAVFTLIMVGWRNPAEQLANTKWKGTLYVPNEIEGTIEFKKDSLTITVAGRVIETSSYSTKSDTLSIKKLSGGSPCAQEIGTYTFTTTDNTLKFTKVDDSCIERGEAFSPNGYKKIN